MSYTSLFLSKEEKAAFLQCLPFYSSLSSPEQELLSRELYLSHYDADSPVYGGESPCPGTVFIKQGILRLYLLSEEGREATLCRLREKHVCLPPASCLPPSITFDIRIDAETDCDLYIIPSRIFALLMRENIQVELFACKAVAERFSDVAAAAERIFFMSLRQRICTFLLDESAVRETEELPMTKEQLAKAIGSAREAVSRNLKQLNKEGLILVSRGRIRILDRQGLSQ